jgi:pimeloyl-ACP methyl ester carboxylesterase
LLVIVLACLPVIGWAWRRAAEGRDARRLPFGEYAEIGGRRLHVVRRGHGGPTVVIESGAGFSSSVWWPMQERLANSATVVSYDRAGLGRSDRAPLQRTLSDRVDDLEAMLKQTGLEPPYVLVGWSYGGMLIRIFAHRYPDQVAGLVFVDSGHEAVFSTPGAQTYLRRIAFVQRVFGGLAQTGLLRLLRVRGMPEPATALPRTAEQRRGLGLLTAHSFLAGADEFSSMRAVATAMTGLSTPGTLGSTPIAVITHGKPFPGPFAVLETNHPEGMRALAALSTNSVLTVAENSLHALPLEEPEVVIDAISAVLDAARTGRPLSDTALGALLRLAGHTAVDRDRGVVRQLRPFGVWPPAGHHLDAWLSELKPVEEGLDFRQGPYVHEHAALGEYRGDGRPRLRVEIGREMGKHQVATGGQPVNQVLDQGIRIVGVGDEVQHRKQEQPHRLAQVQGLAHRRRPKDRVEVAEIGVEVPALPLWLAGEQGTSVCQHDGVVVDVDDPALRRDRLGDLVHVGVGRQPGTDVEELPDSRLGRQVPDRSREKAPVLYRRGPDLGVGLEARLGDGAIRREVVLPAEQEVIDPRRVRQIDAKVDPRRGFFGVAMHPLRFSHDAPLGKAGGTGVQSTAVSRWARFTPLWPKTRTRGAVPRYGPTALTRRVAGRGLSPRVPGVSAISSIDITQSDCQF